MWECNDDGSYWGFTPPSKPAKKRKYMKHILGVGIVYGYTSGRCPDGYKFVRSEKAYNRIVRYYYGD
tara:strand:+ start:543 stop:743 length:201 start_codon:yes stop_codon:yes gene_type:complete